MRTLGAAVRLAFFCLVFVHVLNPAAVVIPPPPDPWVFPEPPEPQPPYADITPIEVNVREGWEPRRILVTHEEVRSDRFLWALMFFRDWDRIPRPLRDRGLARMLARFARIIDEPPAWRRMAPEDWDRVPQPIRAMAFINMIARWEACYRVAERFGLPASSVVARLRAIAMAESWFQHRATSRNPDASTDVGLAQATSTTRAILRWRAAAGLTGFRLEDEDYFDPLEATRVLVYWFSLMLAETGGGLDLATRAYHVGSPRARRGEGADYLEGVLRIENLYMLDHAPSPSWSFLRARNPEPSLRAADEDGATPACPSDGAPEPPAGSSRSGR